MKLDWDAIWIEFDEWYEKKKSSLTCKECHHTDFKEPDWPDQQAAIQRIIKKAIRDKEAYL